jgi:serine protease Do
MMTTILEQLNQAMAEVVLQTRQSLVQISHKRGSVGSGTIWREDGLIATNAHVVQSRGRRNRLMVTLGDGRTLPAKLLAVDKTHDLAALKIEAQELPTIQRAGAQTMKPGSWVVGAGHPWGVAGAVTAGAVIDTGQSLERNLPHGELLQVGLHLRPGHSGGPLVDVQGRLVGISAMINGPDVGLAIPVHTVETFMRQVEANLPTQQVQVYI